MHTDKPSKPEHIILGVFKAPLQSSYCNLRMTKQTSVTSGTKVTSSEDTSNSYILISYNQSYQCDMLEVIRFIILCDDIYHHPQSSVTANDIINYHCIDVHKHKMII
jgi:hypothetical protein